MIHKIPFIDLKRSSVSGHEILSKISNSLENCNFSGGVEVEKFERALESKLNVKNVVSCGNGTDALQLALKALDIGKGDNVIVPNLTFWATCEAVVNMGAEPIIVDIEERTFALDPSLVEDAILKFKPKALIVVNLYGGCSTHLEDIFHLALKHGVKVIHDNAQAFGVAYDGISIFQKFSDISTLSFYPAKVLGAAGDAGAVLTSSDNLAKKIRQLANHGRKDHYSYDYFGFNSRLDSIQALYLNEKLALIDAEIQSRKQADEFYFQNIKSDFLSIYAWENRIKNNGYLNISLCNDRLIREKIESILVAEGIGFGRVYPETISSQAVCRNFPNIETGVSEKISKIIINLPLFSGITQNELQYVVSKVNGIQL